MYPLILICMIFMLNPSCALKTVKGINPDFKPYVADFESMHGKPVKFNIGYDTLEEQYVGVCNHVTKTIFIDKGYWDYISEDKKLFLIYHELGHCVLKRSHIKSKFKDNCPTSIMYHEVLTDECIKKYRDYYLMEMFL